MDELNRTAAGTPNDGLHSRPAPASSLCRQGICWQLSPSRLAMAEKDRPMPIFRYCFLDREGHTIFTAISNADDLSGVKHNAFDLSCGEDLSLVMKVHGLEIYNGEECVYPGRAIAGNVA